MLELINLFTALFSIYWCLLLVILHLPIATILGECTVRMSYSGQPVWLSWSWTFPDDRVVLFWLYVTRVLCENRTKSAQMGGAQMLPRIFLFEQSISIPIQPALSFWHIYSPVFHKAIKHLRVLSKADSFVNHHRWNNCRNICTSWAILLFKPGVFELFI